MKSRFPQRVIAIWALGSILVSVPLRAADEPTPAPEPKADEPKPAAADTKVLVVSPATNPPTVVVNPAAPTNVLAPAPVQTFQMPRLSLPPLLDQVVKLSQSGTDEKVIKAYVEKAAPAYRITGNEIVQLRDLGISQDVIMSLIDHSQSAAAASTTEVIAPQTAVAPPLQPQMQAPEQTNVVYAPDAAPEFYDSLAPYGSWSDVPGYGWCWQPSVAVVNVGWQPYCDAGNWLWSDYGWYWHSYYSWGWAPFHYGRWFCHEGNNSWYWCPDRVWGPSWVCWRNSATHCGWAPLPPGACFTSGHGWTHHGKGVDIHHDFGISSSHFTVVSHDKFSDHHVGGQALRGQDAANALRNTHVVNNYALGADNRMVNHGIGRETIAAAAKTPVRDVAVRELARGNTATMPDRVNRVGGSDVVFRPGTQISVPRNSGVVANQQGRTTMAASRNTSPTAVAASRNTSPINPAFAQRIPSRASASAVTATRAMPNYSYSQSRVTTAGSGSSTIMRGSAAPQIQARSTYSRPSAPMASVSRSYTPSMSASRSYAPASRSFTPSASAPRSSAPSVGRSSGGGGGGSRGASTVARSSGGARR